jgi:hypothetical protein
MKFERENVIIEIVSLVVGEGDAEKTDILSFDYLHLDVECEERIVREGPLGFRA